MDIIQYSEEHRIFREAVKKFFEKEVTPHIEELGRSGHRAEKRLEKDGRAGIFVYGYPGGIWWRGGGFPLFDYPYGRTGEDRLHRSGRTPSQRYCGSVYQHLRIRGNQAEISSGVCVWRYYYGRGHDRAQHGERPGGHSDDRGGGWRRGGAQRSEDLHQQRHQL